MRFLWNRSPSRSRTWLASLDLSSFAEAIFALVRHFGSYDILFTVSKITEISVDLRTVDDTFDCCDCGDLRVAVSLLSYNTPSNKNGGSLSPAVFI